jgi:hypothetical protein
MSIYPAGVQNAVSLTGAELVEIDAGGAVKLQCTTDQIAALAASAAGVGIVNTAITTVGNGTLTAAGLVGGLIVRTGPTGAFSDATDTAANIIAALPSVVVGSTFFIRIKNATAYPETITAGVGVTLPSTNLVAPFSYALYYGTISTVSTVTLTHLNTTAIASAASVVNPIATALNTVGAGTVVAAAIVGGFVARGGSQSNTAFADTTDTAAAIIAASAGMLGRIGESFVFHYQNTTNASCTLGGGTGVTVSGITVIPGGTWADYLVTYTAAATITMVGIASSPPVTASGTFVNNGVSAVTTADTRLTANSVVVISLKTVGGTVGAIPHLETVTPGTGFTTIGTASDTSTYNYLIIG